MPCGFWASEFEGHVSHVKSYNKKRVKAGETQPIRRYIEYSASVEEDHRKATPASYLLDCSAAGRQVNDCDNHRDH